MEDIVRYSSVRKYLVLESHLFLKTKFRLFIKFRMEYTERFPTVTLCITVIEEHSFYCMVGIAVEDAISPASPDLHSCVIVFTCVWKFIP